MPTPHDSWADVYDTVYQREFGHIYTQLTAEHVSLVRGIVAPPARILDIGAATGRLAIPLVRAGYNVKAVEPSTGMLRVLAAKVDGHGVQACAVRIQDYSHGLEEAPYDLALCLFTTTLYLLTEDDLRRASENMAAALTPDGSLLVDVAVNDQLFKSRKADLALGGLRVVKITPDAAPCTYLYHEDIELLIDGETRRYRDDFLIRRWSPDEIIKALAPHFELVEEKRTEINTGSRVFLLKKSDILETKGHGGFRSE